MRPRRSDTPRRSSARVGETVVALLTCLIVTLAPGTSATGAVIVVETPAGTVVGSQLVSARATFTTSADRVDVLLENLYADPKSVGQNLSGLRFTLDTVPTSGVSLTESSGTERDIARNGTFTIGATVPTGWSLSSSGADVTLNVLGSPVGPEYTIVGPPNATTGEYEVANRSITGNGPHNPFIGTSATFTIGATGVLPTSLVGDVMFQFNTAPGFTAGGEIKLLEREIPEPAGLGVVLSMTLLQLPRRRIPRRTIPI